MNKKLIIILFRRGSQDEFVFLFSFRDGVT